MKIRNILDKIKYTNAAPGSLALLAFIAMSADANATPLPDLGSYGVRTGYLADDPSIGRERMTYDPSEQRLSYLSGMATYRLGFCSGCGGPSAPGNDYGGPVADSKSQTRRSKSSGDTVVKSYSIDAVS